MHLRWEIFSHYFFKYFPHSSLSKPWSSRVSCGFVLSHRSHRLALFPAFSLFVQHLGGSFKEALRMLDSMPCDWLVTLLTAFSGAHTLFFISGLLCPPFLLKMLVFSTFTNACLLFHVFLPVKSPMPLPGLLLLAVLPPASFLPDHFFLFLFLFILAVMSFCFIPSRTVGFSSRSYRT